MFKVGDKVVLRYDDSEFNQPIVGKKVTVVVAPSPAMQSPFWMTVEWEGYEFEVRGADCTPVK